VRLAIILLEVREGFVREDHAPPERDALGVSFDDGDVGRGVRLLVEEREVEPCGPAADADDPHCEGARSTARGRAPSASSPRDRRLIGAGPEGAPPARSRGGSWSAP